MPLPQKGNVKFTLHWSGKEIEAHNNLAAMWGYDSQVSRDPVTTFYFHQITNHHVFSINLLLLTITDNQCLLEKKKGL